MPTERGASRKQFLISQDALAFEAGTGGLLDAEFLAQAFCLAHGWHEPNTLRALERARQSGALPAKDADALLTSYRQLRHVEGIRRRWGHVGELLLPEARGEQKCVAMRCGFTSAAAFLKALNGWRAEMRRVFKSVLRIHPANPLEEAEAGEVCGCD